MIDWLMQSCDDLPVDIGWLCAEERFRYLSFANEKRRRDWLLGRWTAKQLLRGVVGDQYSLTEIAVLSELDGAPLVCIEGLPSPVLSISHSRGHSFCAMVQDGAALGADLEWIEPRVPGFVEDYFTEDEQALVQDAPLPEILITAIWSAKEAALKALRLGLTVDTRAVSCRIEPGTPHDWTPFPLELDVERLKRAADWIGWWRITEGFVLTMVSEPQHQPLRSN